MDIEILANRLLEYALNENATEYDRQVMADAAHELSRLFMDKNQAESRAERHGRDNAALTSENKKLRAELEQVKRERDAAISDLETIMAYGGGNLDTCQYCKNGQCYARGGTKLCLPQWRGQKED